MHLMDNQLNSVLGAKESRVEGFRGCVVWNVGGVHVMQTKVRGFEELV